MKPAFTSLDIAQVVAVFRPRFRDRKTDPVLRSKSGEEDKGRVSEAMAERVARLESRAALTSGEKLD